MSAQAAAARTPGAKRAGPGEYVFDLGRVNHIKGGPDYSSVEGGVVEGDRMIVALMRMPAGTGAEPHSHPNEQWIYILEGTFKARIGDDEVEAKPGSVVYVPSNVVHSAKATADADVVFFTVKDASHSLHGVKAGDCLAVESIREDIMKRIGLDHRGAGVPRTRRRRIERRPGRRTNSRSSR